MKRLMRFGLLLAVVLCIIVLGAFAQTSEDCGYGLVWWVSEDGSLTIEGVGDMLDFDSETGAPWADRAGDFHAVHIGESVYSIGDNAFAGCTLTDVYYYGTSSNWALVDIGSGNEALESATVHYLPWFYFYNGDQTHAAEAFCDCCYTAISGGILPCVDADVDYICDQCGGELCDHLEMTMVYVSNGNKKHTVTQACAQCGLVIDTVEETCYDFDNDYMCDFCWSQLCGHMSYEVAYYPMGGGTHSTATVCADCGTAVEQQTQICIDANGDYRCDYCGDSSCDHKKQNSTYVAAGDKTHIVTSVCAQCGKSMGSYTGRCVDLDGDYKCQFCGTWLCEHTDTTVSYETGENGSHTVRETCQCGEVVSTETVDCADDDADTLCDVCGAQITQLVKVNVGGSNMTLGNDLKMNFMVKTDELQDGLTMRVTQDGKEPVVLTPEKYNSTYHYVAYSVAAKEMTDVLTVEVLNADGYVISEPYTRTIAYYATNLLTKSTSTDKLKSVAVDMLNYGTEAQKYFSYNEDDYANANISAEDQAAYATTGATCDVQRTLGTNAAGTNLSLEASILLNVFFNSTTADGMTATVTYTNYKGAEVTAEAAVEKYSSSRVKVVVDEIVLADTKRPVTVTVYKDGAEYGSCTEAVGGYATRKLEDSTMGSICQAILNFATSAYTYLGGTH